MSILLNDFMENTLLRTPEPKACSTIIASSERKPRTSRDNRSLDQSNESLGLLPLDVIRDKQTTHSLLSSFDMSKYKKRDDGLYDVMSRESFMRFPEAVTAESTVNESDLIEKQLESSHQNSWDDKEIKKIQEAARKTLEAFSRMSSFRESKTTLPDQSNQSIGSTKGGANPCQDMSLPLAESTIGESDLALQMSEMKVGNVSIDMASDISDKLRNSNVSMKDLMASFATTNDYSSIGSDMFENAQKKIDEGEVSWRKKYGLPVSETSIDFSMSSASGKPSIGQFFQRKSKDDTNIFAKISPPKRDPVGLLESDVSSADTSAATDVSSILSISSIRDLISNGGTPTKLIEKLTEPRRSLSSRASVESSRANKLPVLRAAVSSTDVFGSREYSQTHDSDCLSDSSDSDKENVSRNRSSASVRSADSIETLQDGKQLKASCKEVIWDCVKIGKTETREFTMKNVSDQKIRYMLSVKDTCFGIHNQENEIVSTVTYLLHGYESKLVRVSFCPLKIGVHDCKLYLHPVVKGELRKSQSSQIVLKGYGGHVNLITLGVQKTSTGDCLSLGPIKPGAMTTCIKVKNIGTIPGFAYFNLRKIGLNVFQTITVEPRSVVIRPGQYVEIAITYKPSYAEYEKMTTAFNRGLSVYDLATIELIASSEVLRGKLRRIHEDMKKRNLPIPDVELIPKLTAVFVDECVPPDFHHSVQTNSKDVRELLSKLNPTLIKLSIENDPDRTVVPEMDPDESSIYHSLCDNTDVTVIDNKPEVILEPSVMLLTLPMKPTDRVILTSMSPRDVQYEVQFEPEGIIDVGEHERFGVIKPRQMKMLTVSYVHRQSNHYKVVMKVFTNKDCLESHIKVLAM